MVMIVSSVFSCDVRNNKTMSKCKTLAVNKKTQMSRGLGTSEQGVLPHIEVVDIVSFRATRKELRRLFSCTCAHSVTCCLRLE
jgi:hypothetical protein